MHGEIEKSRKWRKIELIFSHRFRQNQKDSAQVKSLQVFRCVCTLYIMYTKDWFLQTNAHFPRFNKAKQTQLNTQPI